MENKMQLHSSFSLFKTLGIGTTVLAVAVAIGAGIEKMSKMDTVLDNALLMKNYQIMEVDAETLSLGRAAVQLKSMGYTGTESGSGHDAVDDKINFIVQDTQKIVDQGVSGNNNEMHGLSKDLHALSIELPSVKRGPIEAEVRAFDKKFRIKPPSLK